MDDVQTVAWRSKSYAPWMDGKWAWAFTANENDLTLEHEPLVLRSDYESLAERVRELEGDAARYRWLRAWVMRGGKRSEIDGLGHIRVQTVEIFDAGVDSAMQQDAERGGVMSEACGEQAGRIASGMGQGDHMP